MTARNTARFAAVAASALMLGALGLAGCQKAAEDSATEAVSMETSQDVMAEATATDAAVEEASTDTTATYADAGSTVTAVVTPTASYRITDGDRVFYYRTGEDAPYLVRRGEEYYSFKDGALDRVMDARGRDLAGRRDAVRKEAEQWADRGRDLKDKAEPRLPTPSQSSPSQGERPTGGTLQQEHGSTMGRPTTGTQNSGTQAPGASGSTDRTPGRSSSGRAEQEQTPSHQTSSHQTASRASSQPGSRTEEKTTATAGRRPDQQGATGASERPGR